MKFPVCQKCGFAVRKYLDGKCVDRANKVHIDIWEHYDCAYHKRMRAMKKRSRTLQK